MILHLGPDTNVLVYIVASLLPCIIDVYGSHVNTLLCSHGQENWWAFTATAAGIYTFDSCGSAFDT